MLVVMPCFSKVECKEVFDHMAQGDVFSVQLLDEIFERIACLCKTTNMSENSFADHMRLFYLSFFLQALTSAVW